MAERDWLGITSILLEEGVKALVPGSSVVVGLASQALEPEMGRLRQWRSEKAERESYLDSVTTWARGKEIGDADIEDGLKVAAGLLRRRGADMERLADLNLDAKRVSAEVAAGNWQLQQDLSDDGREVCRYAVLVFYLRLIQQNHDALNRAVQQVLLVRADENQRLAEAGLETGLRIESKLDLSEKLASVLAAISEGQASDARRLFEDHIDPLQRRMEEIHDDYIRGFEEAARLLDKEGPSQELIDFLKERRREMAAQRQMARDLSTELQKMNGRGVKQQSRIAIEAYCQSIISYFNVPGSMSRISWFNDYIRMLEARVRLAREVPGMGSADWPTGAVTGHPRQDLREQISVTLDRALPRSFSKVSAAYAEVRRRLL